ncbi:ABC transporter substrate-binding protein [Halalkalibacter krulwichiae]|uniref:ABC transporter substrate binding protein n=1 Tax=Halalkalibacter krulwichiae TaxID=199441 RepID=A0A1X9M831_9BACI|nr:ABC transporter substrate-binding protein [Halalkalibacter krulwichiae]ARK29589.1 ABC transporter substrate binding protein [Halalkalibacter krulwichiae]
MKKRWFKSMGALVAGMVLLTACGAEESGSEADDQTNETTEEAPATEGTEEILIGASQIVEHPSLDAAFEGFKSALADNGFVEGENTTYDFQSAQGDQNNANTIATNFVGNQVDLIFANSTPSSLAALNATNDIPIVFTSVTDAVGAGLVSSLDEPGENITGVLDLHPESIEMTIEFISANFPEATIGTIYNAGEQNSVAQIEAVEAAIEGTDLTLVTRTVSTSAEVQQAATTLVGDIDLFYIVTDNTVVSALETVAAVGSDYQIPLIVGEPDSLDRGGFATYGIDYYTIGYRAGEMAAEILKGEKTTSDIPVEIPPSMTLMINKENAEAQGVTWNEEWDSIAEFVNQD